jgi:ABC-type sulfate/molybdate transport systems ATPase subunit
MIGQRGVSLSGGQRARVGLARAVYSDADIFLLDDPLSAVDATVGQHIFDKCICDELSGRIRILVTHQLQHLHRADEIVVLKEGRILDHGSHDHISQDSTVSKMLADYKTANIKALSTDHRDPLSFKDDLSERMGRDMIEEDEDRVAGSVSWRLYWDYLSIGLPAPLIICLVVVFIVAQGNRVIKGFL